MSAILPVNLRDPCRGEQANSALLETALTLLRDAQSDYSSAVDHSMGSYCVLLMAASDRWLRPWVLSKTPGVKNPPDCPKLAGSDKWALHDHPHNDIYSVVMLCVLGLNASIESGDGEVGTRIFPPNSVQPGGVRITIDLGGVI